MRIYLSSFTSGVADQGQAVNEKVEYCTNVKAGIWPDFNENYQQLCLDNIR